MSIQLYSASYTPLANTNYIHTYFLSFFQTSEICRDILCPSGQIRTPTGCKIPSKSWFVGLVSLSVQLNYPESQHDKIQTLFQRGRIKQTDMKERFLENKPWPSLWKLMIIGHTVESHPERAVLIYLVCESNDPAILFHSIKTRLVCNGQ